MKLIAIRVLAIFVISLVVLKASSQQNVVFKPEKPQPGELLTFSYNPTSTSLSGKQGFDATAYLLTSEDLPFARKIKLIKQGNIYTGQIKTAENTKSVFIVFSKDELKDNNNENGYFILMFNKNGDPVEGSKLSAGQAFVYYSYDLKLQPDPAKGVQFMKEEFSKPGAMEKYKAKYLSMLSQSKDPADKKELKDQLQKIAEDPLAKEDDLLTAQTYYQFFRDTAKANEVKNLLNQKFPEGKWKKQEMITAFNKEKDNLKKEMIYQQLIKDFPPTENDKEQYQGFLRSLAIAFAESGDFEKAKVYLNKIKNPGTKADALNSIAWKLSGEGIDGKPINVKLGKELSAESLNLMKSQINTLQNKPVFYTSDQWKEELEHSYAWYADTYATLLYHKKEYKAAYDIERAAARTFKYTYPDINTTLAVLVEKNQGKEAAKKEVEKFVRMGKYSSKMKNQLKTIYLGQKHSEEEWNTYFSALVKANMEKRKKELSKEMVTIPAPAFKLKDISGNEIALEKLKGKTVVVDFWATWCGPCKASFPGMQQIVNKFSSDSNVVFLFIDTWETDKNRDSLVKTFIEKNKYSFKVLYDQLKDNDPRSFAVVSDYNVNGIPTKFIIDKNNNIRFKSIGFGGNQDELISELSYMIEIAGRDENTTKQ